MTDTFLDTTAAYGRILHLPAWYTTSPEKLAAPVPVALGPTITVIRRNGETVRRTIVDRLK